MYPKKTNIIYSFAAFILLILISINHISFSIRETRPMLADELEYGYLSIPYYHLTFNSENISEHKHQYLLKTYTDNIADVTLLHKYLALNYHLFGKTITVFRLSLLLLLYLMLFSIFLLSYVLCKNKHVPLLSIYLLCSSPIFISYSRMLWTPLYSGSFILIGLATYMLSQKLTKKAYLFFSALSFAIACSFHYSGLLFSGIFMLLIITENIKERKKELLLFNIIFLLPQIKTLPLMLLAKTSGCINGINPPNHILKYAFIQLQNLFWHKSIFYFLLILFILSSLYHLIINRKKTTNIIFLFYALMIPSLWLIKINTGIQTHFVMLSLALILTLHTASTFPKLKLQYIIAALALIGFSLNFTDIIPNKDNQEFYTLALKADETNLKTNKLIKLIEKENNNLSTITVLNPDEFQHQNKYPVDAFHLELTIPNSDKMLFASINKKEDINRTIDNMENFPLCFIVEENNNKDNHFLHSLKTSLSQNNNLKKKNIIISDDTKFTLFLFD